MPSASNCEINGCQQPTAQTYTTFTRTFRLCAAHAERMKTQLAQELAGDGISKELSDSMFDHSAEWVTFAKWGMKVLGVWK